ncbi:MAG TPA: hypothetical protein VFW33_22765 [Gemmataceae bacterium]|nr:hypothetical protein [Gemmataceae bacterium]
MSRFLTGVLNTVKRLSATTSVPRPRRAGLAVESLEDRLVPAGVWGWGDPPPASPWSYTVPSGHSQDTIIVNAIGSQLQVLDVSGGQVNTTTVSLTGVSSITLTGGTGTNTFDVQSTPAGVPMTVKFTTALDSALVGSNGSAQGVKGNVSFYGYNGSGTVTVDDSADTTAHSASLFNGALSGLAPASVFINNLPSLVVKANPSAGNSIQMVNSRTSANTFTGAPGKSTLGGGGVTLEVDNFFKVDAIGETTGDSATLSGSTAGANTLSARYAATGLSGPGYSLEVDYFGHADAIGATSRDVANVSGLSGYCNESHVGEDPDGSVSGNIYSIASTSLSDTENAFWSPISSYAYWRSLRGFHGVTLNAGSANDFVMMSADFYSPCSFVGLANSAFLGGKGWAIQANAFAQVMANGNPSSPSLMVSTPGDSTIYSAGQAGNGMTTPTGYVEGLGFGSSQHSTYADLASEAQALNTLLTSLASQYAFPGIYWLTLTQPGSTATQTITW